MFKTNAIPQVLSSNAPGSMVEDLQSIKPPVAIPNPWLWLWVAIGLLLIGAVAWWFWRRRRRKAETPEPEAVIPAHEKAWARLKEALALLDQPRPFCILVSDTVRAYMEERFQLRAPERTTEEFLEELQSSPLLSHPQKGVLGEFLMTCDLVKFARHEPGRDELQAIYDAAARLIEETQPPPSPETQTPVTTQAQ